jgi:hypothetical protein
VPSIATDEEMCYTLRFVGTTVAVGHGVGDVVVMMYVVGARDEEVESVVAMTYKLIVGVGADKHVVRKSVAVVVDIEVLSMVVVVVVVVVVLDVETFEHMKEVAVAAVVVVAQTAPEVEQAQSSFL